MHDLGDVISAFGQIRRTSLQLSSNLHSYQNATFRSIIDRSAVH